MKRLLFCLPWLFALPLLAAITNSLTLIETIPLPDVRGRIDHFALDVKEQRLFMAALGNDTVEVMDLKSNQQIHTIKNCSEPQGLAFAPASNRLIIANGGSGQVDILDAITLKTLFASPDLPDADNVRYDPETDLAYVGYGDGGLAVIRVATGKLLARIPLPAHPESFQLEKEGHRIFVNVPGAQQVAVIDRESRKVTATWPMGDFHSNFPMALDEASHRLFIGCRHPARLVVLDTDSGKRISDLPIDGDTDDVFYDAKRKRIYISCGDGTIEVIDQATPDDYRLDESIKTVSGARTSFFSPVMDELFLAVRAGFLSGTAEVRIYRLQP